MLLAVAACGGPPPPAQAASGAQSPAAGQRVLSISANPKAGSSDVAAAVDLAYGAGARGYFESYAWSAIEPKAGALTVSKVRDSIDYLANKRGLTLLLGIQVINTTVKATPADLSSAAFDSAQTKARFHALIDALKPGISGNVRYLSIGNEVDVYLMTHQEQWSPYQAFYDDAVAYVHSTLPGVKVGVTATFGGAVGSAAEKIARLNRSSDIYLLTYYPLGPSFRPRAPSIADQDLAQMLSRAQGKPLVLQEVGYPSAPQLGSSEQAQATFISTVLATWKAVATGRLPFLNVFLLHDLSVSTCDQLASYYGLGADANFKSYLCSLGFRRADGTPKLAWPALVDGVHRLPSG